MKSKARSKESGGRQIKYVEVSGSRIRETIVTNATLNDYVMSSQDGKPVTVYLGIDPGLTQQTVCLITRLQNGARKVEFVASFTKADKGDKSWQTRFHRIGYLTWAIEKILSLIDRDSWIGIEGYASRSKGSAVQTMAEIKQSLLLTIFAKHGLSRVVMLQPMSWKACLVEKGGKLDKIGVMDEVCRQWPRMSWLRSTKGAHNYFDAYAMATVVEALAEGKHSVALDRLRERESIE